MSKLSIAVFFLTCSAAIYAQETKNDSVKTEKRIEGVTIRANVKKSAESSIVAEQKKSVEVIERVGTTQLAKQGVSNAATAVTKATGTVKQEGSNTISVRGLLDRYNTTTLNSLPIPSDDPENKNIDLSILKTDMIEYIGLEKIFTPRLSGDFGGANINIVSREHSGKPFLEVTLGSGINTQVINSGPFYMQQGHDFFGFKNPSLPANPLSSYQYNNSWNFKDSFTPMNSEFGISGGKTFNLGSGRLNTYFYTGFENDFSFMQGREGSFGKETPFTDFNDSKRYEYGTNTTAIANLIYRINSNNSLRFVSNYIHSSELTTRILRGFIRDTAEDYNGYIRRSDYKLTSLFINQLGGEHQLSEKFEVDWMIGYNSIDSDRPERLTNELSLNQNNLYVVRRDAGSSNRFWDSLKDKEFDGNLDLNYKFSDKAKLAFGFQARTKDRNYESRQIDFKWLNRNGQAVVADPNNIDSVFNAQNYASGLFTMASNLTSTNGELIPITFDGSQDVYAGYINIDYNFSDRFIAQIGGRFETIKQNISWHTNFEVPDIPEKQIGSDYQKFLPALNLKYSLNDKTNLRLSASRTYTLPQLKEMAPFLYSDVSEQTVGNPKLYPSDNNNMDLKYEYFPKSGEVLSLAVFGKFIENPIAKTFINSSDPYFSYLNVGDKAQVFGVEAEIRKDIVKFTNSKIYAFGNATYMDTKSDLSNEKVQQESAGYSVNFDKTEDKLQGAANFMANANLGFNQKWEGAKEMDFVISYAHVGEYIYSLSTNESGNIIQKPINLLDATLRFSLNKISIGLKGRNLLNPKVQRIQENVNQNITREYKNGSEVSLTIGYKF